MARDLSSELRSIADYHDLRGKRVLVRAGLNAPIENGVVTNDFRVRKALPTIELLRERGARIILLSHTSKAGEEGVESLQPICDALRAYVPTVWGGDAFAEEAVETVAGLEDGDVMLMENVRMHKEEKANDPRYAAALAKLGDIYVNDAFADSHREHASVVGIPKHLPGYAGLLMREEVVNLSRALTPEHPALFVLGGAKFDTKMPLVEKFIETYDRVFVGGALANDFFRARGYEVGKSLTSPVDLRNSPLAKHPRLLLPIDVTVRTETGDRAIRLVHEVQSSDTILDAGPATIDMLREQIRFARTILWNGPLGDYEQDFSEQTTAFAREVAQTHTTSIVGGGDTIASIEKLDVVDKFSFISTGGGAMLTFLEHGTLPGIDALLSSPR